MLLKEVPTDSGLIRFGTNVFIGYYDQEQAKLDESKTIFEEISDTYSHPDAGANPQYACRLRIHGG